jgi:hypothetical protein
VFGRFAEDDADASFKDVEWVDLDDLMTNLTDDQLKPLVKYEKALATRMASAKKRLRTAQADVDLISARIVLRVSSVSCRARKVTRNRNDFSITPTGYSAAAASEKRA